MSAETILHGLAARCDEAFPDRVRSAYLEGSGADDTRIATSDLDGAISFRDQLAPAERAVVERLVEEYGRAAGIVLDVELTDEAAVAHGVSPALKEAGQLVWGDEIRDRLPLIPLAAWTRDRMYTSYWRTITLFGRTVPTRLPLGAPDPDDEFLGYCRRPVRLADGAEVPSTRDLIRHVGWAATGLLALRAGRYVARKRDCHLLYAELIGDEWTALLVDLYGRCRGEWGYRLPASSADRAALRAICARMLAFENHFLGNYRTFLLAELRGADESAGASARWVLTKLPLDDAAVIAASAAVSEEGPG